MGFMMRNASSAKVALLVEVGSGGCTWITLELRSHRLRSSIGPADLFDEAKHHRARLPVLTSALSRREFRGTPGIKTTNSSADSGQRVSRLRMLKAAFFSALRS